eukprot:380687-Hanusia_phi.AAC.7
MRTDTVHESKHGRYLVRQKNYIDSTLLFRALAESSDYLASGLIAASPVLSQVGSRLRTSRSLASSGSFPTLRARKTCTSSRWKRGEELREALTP